MKKLILWGLLAIFPFAVNGQELETGVPSKQEPFYLPVWGLLHAVIVDKKEAVFVLPEVVFEAPFNQISLTPAEQAAVRRVQELTYTYFVRAWKAWREAANVYLPANYQLLPLSFTLAESVQTRPAPNMFAVHLVSFFPARRLEHLGKLISSPSNVAQLELVLPIHLLKYWTFSNPDPLQQALMAGDLRNALCNISVGESSYWESLVLKGARLEDVQWVHHYQPLEKEEAACLRTLMTLPADEWVYRGPFAQYLQHIMTHEWGHLLGINHVDNSIMSTSKGIDWAQFNPSAQDGLLLAEVVCAHHNRQAGKTVCRPHAAPAVKQKK